MYRDVFCVHRYLLSVNAFCMHVNTDWDAVHDDVLVMLLSSIVPD